MAKGNIIKGELTKLGIDGATMRREILPSEEYGIGTVTNPVSEAFYSLAISGKRDSELAVKIREACWDYIKKHQKEK